MNSADGLPTVRVGGVPEHFNTPWHLAAQRGLFAAHGVAVEFVEMRAGTGAMLQALHEDKLDIIVALTEGLVADIAKGSDVRLLGTYVDTPLCWAVSTKGSNDLSSPRCIDDLRGKTIGISRFSSGSHLMACVLAAQRGWDPASDLKFKVLGPIDQLLAGVNDGSADAFLWETFTTKPYHDQGLVRRIGDITTPWPCFMLAAKNTALADSTRAAAIQAALEAVREAAEQFHAERETMPALVAARYGLQLEDALAWYANVKISASSGVSKAALARVLQSLESARVLEKGLVEQTMKDPSRLLALPIATLTYDDTPVIEALQNTDRFPKELRNEVYAVFRQICDAIGGLFAGGAWRF